MSESSNSLMEQAWVRELGLTREETLEAQPRYQGALGERRAGAQEVPHGTRDLGVIARDRLHPDPPAPGGHIRRSVTVSAQRVGPTCRPVDELHRHRRGAMPRSLDEVRAA